MKKQFDLNYYLAHPETRVETRNGIAVRIVNTDAKSPEGYHVVGLLTDKYDDCETPCRFTAAGEYSKSGKSAFDLFFDLSDPVKKKVPLTYEDLLKRAVAGKTMWIIRDAYKYAKSIIDFDDKDFHIVDGFYRLNRYPIIIKLHLEEMMEYHFADGDPCWKEGGEE